LESRRNEADAGCPKYGSAEVMRQWTARDKIAVPKQSIITIRPTDSFLTIAIAYYLSLTYPANKLNALMLQVSKIYKYLSVSL
jgi:hypothetical protein